MLAFSTTKQTPMTCTEDTVKPDGFNVWVECPDAEVDIILIQGLDANPYYTWLWQAQVAKNKLHTRSVSVKNAKRKCFWINELLPKHLTKARIATYAYQTRWRSKDFATGLRECGDALLQYLQLDWMPKNNNRPIILVGHSFGGLVIQQALVTANHGIAHRDFREAVSAIMFLGVPMQGTTLANMGSWIERINKSAGLMKTLSKDSPELRALLCDFYAAYNQLPITCFTERERSSYGLLNVQTVQDNSATILGKDQIFLDTDHSGLNKFSGDEDEDSNFHRFVIRLKQYVTMAIDAWAEKQERESFEDESRHQSALKWLQAPDPFINYYKARSLCLEGTGQWLLDSRAFLEWKSSEASFLWLHGLPGCGKTVLSSTVLYQLQQQSKGWRSILFFYFDFRDKQKQTLDACLRGLLAQICSSYGKGSKSLYALYQSCGAGSHRPSTSELESLFLNLIQDIGHFWVILDALDECTLTDDSNRSGTLSWIEKLANESRNRIRLLVTSRAEYDIENSFKSWARKQDMIALQSADVKQDINEYIKSRVRNDNGLRKWHKRREVVAEIESQLSQKANGIVPARCTREMSRLAELEKSFTGITKNAGRDI
ncbi:hypothetical protein K461DRAFT_120051 [Myriangium duriaei CBS 260.36]|uniref:Nephrocystin 3-like N-terminal domain-containing protein n=1 Tax=Myriangium duriaei CBS 260.36 TaxID=1168546 RepID=A0A9P4J3R1_9PEZI|nr:hypothetical protein K461DRAFT_120051 [Myriangium duriaei CBS 260.36]